MGHLISFFVTFFAALLGTFLSFLIIFKYYKKSEAINLNQTPATTAAQLSQNKSISPQPDEGVFSVSFSNNIHQSKIKGAEMLYANKKTTTKTFDAEDYLRQPDPYSLAIQAVICDEGESYEAVPYDDREFGQSIGDVLA